MIHQKSAKEIANNILKNPNGYTLETVKLAEAYIRLLHGFGIYEDDKAFKSH